MDQALLFAESSDSDYWSHLQEVASATDIMTTLFDENDSSKQLPESPDSVLDEALNPSGDESTMEDATSLCQIQDFSQDFCIDPDFNFEMDGVVASENGAASEEVEHMSCRLLHLLLAGAEAAFSEMLDLAIVILQRIRELISTSSGSTAIERIGIYFAEGLQALLDGSKIHKILNHTSYMETVTAFQVLHEASPYIKFGHYIANQAILEAAQNHKRIHILDYEIAEGIQWPSLMQALATREGGPPHLRITALYWPHLKNRLGLIQETKERLVECAAAFKVPFSFHQTKIENEEDVHLVGLRIVKGEPLFVNCMLHLLHMPHKSPSSILSFLEHVHKLSPTLLTFVHEQVISSPTSSNFPEKFFQALHHYCAMVDSLEASLCGSTPSMLIERVFLATRIKTALIALSKCNHVAPSDSPDSQPDPSWSASLNQAGFSPAPLSSENVCQAKLLVGLFKEGYQIEQETRFDDRLILSWKSKPLITASNWTCNINCEYGETES